MRDCDFASQEEQDGVRSVGLDGFNFASARVFDDFVDELDLAPNPGCLGKTVVSDATTIRIIIE